MATDKKQINLRLRNDLREFGDIFLKTTDNGSRDEFIATAYEEHLIKNLEKITHNKYKMPDGFLDMCKDLLKMREKIIQEMNAENDKLISFISAYETVLQKSNEEQVNSTLDKLSAIELYMSRYGNQNINATATIVLKKHLDDNTVLKLGDLWYTIYSNKQLAERKYEVTNQIINYISTESDKEIIMMESDNSIIPYVIGYMYRNVLNSKILSQQNPIPEPVSDTIADCNTCYQ